MIGFGFTKFGLIWKAGIVFVHHRDCVLCILMKFLFRRYKDSIVAVIQFLVKMGSYLSEPWVYLTVFISG
jgi:hypothetical protein